MEDDGVIVLVTIVAGKRHTHKAASLLLLNILLWFHSRIIHIISMRMVEETTYQPSNENPQCLTVCAYTHTHCDGGDRTIVERYCECDVIQCNIAMSIMCFLCSSIKWNNTFDMQKQSNPPPPPPTFLAQKVVLQTRLGNRAW